ncbi:MAG: ABC transporter ATP-binding protein [Cytophagaceae bacterium]|nr:ABC transporter ATP-binding protein [Cytophagaceae bacterium]
MKKDDTQEKPKNAFQKWVHSFISLRYLPRFFSLVYRSSPSYFMANVALRLVNAAFPVILLWVGKEIIDEVINLTQATTVTYERLFMLIGIEIGLVILGDIFSRLITLTDNLMGALYGNASSVELIQKTARVEIADLEDSEFYDKLERARRQTTSRVALLSSVLSQVQDIITIVSLIVALFYFYPILIILVILSVIPSFVNEMKFSKENYALQSRMTPERRELDYMRMLGASDITAKEVKLFGLADFISDSFTKVADKFYLETKKLAIKSTYLGALFHIISDMAYYGAYVFIIMKAVVVAITIGELTFLAGSFNKLRKQIETIFSRFTSINESALYLKDYFEFIDMEFDNDTGFELYPLPQEIKHGFEFVDVSFKYPNTKKKIFDKISFTLHKGEKLALVGKNGSGKTTLIKLLLRFYEPTAGRILLDGVDIRHFDKAAYQQLFGAIFQDFVRYYLTAKVNIAVGNIKEADNLDKIKEAATLSLADEVIESLKKGYDQELGKRFRKGTELSGGQWQKIAIARAYMSQSPVVILDEPTSALDAQAEYEVFQRFMGLTEGRTSIIISHRFSTVRMADRILVLEHGKIVEHGTHHELMKNDQLYAQLFDLQAEGYRD